jgi:serine/threonine protein kinase
LALHLSELEKMYRLAEPITEGFDIYKSILNGIVEKSSPRSQRLGQYLVLKPLETSGYRRDFKGRDVPPNEVDVMLTEYAWDVLWPEDEIKQFVKNISTEMRALRKLRHPYIACLTGHFVTPNSIVQVSDWFDGKSIRDYWDEGSEFSIREKLHIMINLGEALHYCHLNAIFHRNITERAILVSDDFQDVRLSRFDCAKMLDISGTLPTEKLTSRPIDHQAPEEFDSQSPVDSKKVDIFQFGVMMFRILFDGSRPFADSLEIDEDNPVFGELDELDSIDDSLRALIRKSLNADPKKRTDSMLEVVSKLREAIRNL